MILEKHAKAATSWVPEAFGQPRERESFPIPTPVFSSTAKLLNTPVQLIWVISHDIKVWNCSRG